MKVMITHIHNLLNSLESVGFILDEDVAWVSVDEDILHIIPGDHFVCPVRFVSCVKYRGVEFRASPWFRATAGLHPVWNMTKRTRELMTNPSSPLHRFKDRLQHV